MRLTWSWMALAALVACSPGDAAIDRSGDEPADADTDGSGEDDTADPDAVGPAFWSVRGVVLVRDGAADVASTSFDVTFHDPSGAPWSDGDTATCAFLAAAVADGPPRADDAAPLASWWRWTLIDAEDPCPFVVPRFDRLGAPDGAEIALGFGPLTPSLQAPMAAVGLDPDLPVYGVVGRAPTATGSVEVAFGVAGTEAQFEGDGAVQLEPPLADGTYLVRTLALLPMRDPG